MTKNDIVLRIARDMGVQQTEMKQVVQKVLEGIIDVLVTKGRLELRGFGTFSVRTRRPRRARNPKSGQTVMVGERKHVTFKPGRIMKEKILGTKNETVPEAETSPTVPSPTPAPPA